MLKIINAKDIVVDEICKRQRESMPDVSAAVNDILQDVRRRGDAALLEYTQRFDGVTPKTLRVSKREINQAVSSIDAEFMDILRFAKKNIEAFHRQQLRQGFVLAQEGGIVMGQKLSPLSSVGVYVPGGTAAYPSTVLMACLPAKIAGVQRIAMVSPPGPGGSIPADILAAAHVAGVDEIYTVGGAQAVAALCYGTASIAAVNKIVGPGNLYVATAKRLVYGLVDIDMVAGPSDILVLADESASAQLVAADMLAQAEHDENAAAVLISTSPGLAQQVNLQLKTQLQALPRAPIAKAALLANGKIILAQNMQQAIQLANAFAPEHLELCTADAFALLGSIQNAGSIFLGHHCPEALGDYLAGPNHTLPTGGTARFHSPLSVDDFIKKSSYLYYSKQALQGVAGMVQTFAQREGLQAHANSVALRMQAYNKL